MLFQQLYNWIKYKTLPPSFLFKNRLFIERDSKHRRITNNFGLIFRNSKWSNYEMHNLKITFKHDYYNIFYFFSVVAFILFSIFLSHYYSISTIFNGVAFIFWSGMDIIDYYITFCIWSTFMLSSLFFDTLYSYFFITHVPREKVVKRRKFLKRFANREYSVIIDPLPIAKKDKKWILYSWISKTTAKQKNWMLENIFSFSRDSAHWKILSSFFQKLYALAFFIDQNMYRTNAFDVRNILAWTQLPSSRFFMDSFLLNNSFTSSTFLAIRNYKTRFLVNFDSLKLEFNELIATGDWNASKAALKDLWAMASKIANLFYFFDFSNSEFFFLNKKFQEFYLVNINSINKLKKSKTHRWLYRYSIVHRRSFKNSHKLTLLKRAINSGLASYELNKKNIWNSEILKKFKSINAFRPLSNLLYPSVYRNNFQNLNFYTNFGNNNDYNFNLKINSFHESSFFWFINRFNLHNYLKTNEVKSNLTNSHNKLANNFNLLPTLLDLKNFPIKSLTFSTNFLFTNFKINNFKLFNNNKIDLNNLKDVFIAEQDLTFFNEANFEILNLTTKNFNISDSSLNSLIYFNYFSNNMIFIKKNKFLPTFKTLKRLNFDAISEDKNFLNDLESFSLFIFK